MALFFLQEGVDELVSAGLILSISAGVARGHIVCLTICLQHDARKPSYAPEAEPPPSDKLRRLSARRQLTDTLRTKLTRNANGRSGREAGIAPSAGSEVHQSFGRRLYGEGEGPQMADCASTGSVPQSYRWPDAHRSCPDSVCGGAISSGLSRIASLRIMADSQNKQTKPVYDRTHKAP